jgi:membrane fusion protein (multidrug efflux system)
MKNRLIIIPTVILLFAACSSKKMESKNMSAPDSVEVFTLKKEMVAKDLALPGELYPWERAEVYAKVQGYVRQLKVDIGDQVRQNDVLVILDAPEVTANFAKAQADLQAAQSRFKASLDNYKRTIEAAKEQGAISEGQMQQVKNQMLSDSSGYEASKASANAYAQMKDYLVVRAAFNGVVTQRNVDAGTLVGNNQKPIMMVENISKLRLRVPVPEIYTSAITEKTSITFTMDAEPSKAFTATLARKSNQIDDKTRTELWEFEVQNKNNDLKSGMYANVKLKIQRGEYSFVVPYSSVVTNLERNFVIRVANGKTEWVDIRNGISMKDRLEIFGPLHEGDQLLVRANDEIKSEKTVISKLLVNK